MADEMDKPMPEGVTIDRSGERPVRKDKRSLLRMLHDELSSHFSANDRTVNDAGKQKGLMEAVDDAVTGAPAPGSQEY